MTYLPPNDIFDFIVNDFESAWNALAKDPSAKGRGNFMFTTQAMVLLEFGSRLCASDTTSSAIKDWSIELFSINPFYATRLPGTCCGKPQDFILPYRNSQGDELLWALWDMARNGHTHQYQQIIAELKDGTCWGISISGADFGRTIEEAKQFPASSHLGFRKEPGGSIWSTIHPETLFLDIKESIVKARLLDRGLTIQTFKRPQKATSPHYNFDSSSLETCFSRNSHFRYL